MKKNKKTNKKQTPLATAKKHWIVYVLPSLFVLAGLILLNNQAAAFKGAGLLVVLLGFSLILKKANEKWHLTDNHLIIEKGVLPWAKKYMEVPVADIYKTDFTPGKLSRFFKLGNINTRRRSEECTGFSSAFIANPDRFSGHVQLLVQKQPEHSLNQLFELKEKGMISEHEFNIIKLGHVTSRHLSR